MQKNCQLMKWDNGYELSNMCFYPIVVIIISTIMDSITSAI